MLYDCIRRNMNIGLSKVLEIIVAFYCSMNIGLSKVLEIIVAFYCSMNIGFSKALEIIVTFYCNRDSTLSMFIVYLLVVVSVGSRSVSVEMTLVEN
jgi:hypothetical protein